MAVVEVIIEDVGEAKAEAEGMYIKDKGEDIRDLEILKAMILKNQNTSKKTKTRMVKGILKRSIIIKKGIM